MAIVAEPEVVVKDEKPEQVVKVGEGATDPKVEPKVQKDTPDDKKSEPVKSEGVKSAPELGLDAALQDEIGKLRVMLREQRGQLAALKEKAGQPVKVKQIEGEDDDAPGQPKPPGQLEQLKADTQQTLNLKRPLLGTLKAVMSHSPEYKDMDSVVTRETQSDIIEMTAEALAQRDGMSIEVATAMVENQLWRLDNPYEFLYRNIKEYHPKFASVKSKGKAPAASAPPTIADKGGGGGGGKGIDGWTAERIDNLPEAELKTVPAAIYEKYMRGELR